MSVKHYPYVGGAFDRIVFDGDGSVWVSEAENAKLRELCVLNWEWAHSCCGNSCKMQTDGCGYGIDRECNYEREIYYRMRELGVDA